MQRRRRGGVTLNLNPAERSPTEFDSDASGRPSLTDTPQKKLTFPPGWLTGWCPPPPFDASQSNSVGLRWRAFKFRGTPPPQRRWRSLRRGAGEAREEGRRLHMGAEEQAADRGAGDKVEHASARTQTPSLWIIKGRRAGAGRPAVAAGARRQEVGSGTALFVIPAKAQISTSASSSSTRGIGGRELRITQIVDPEPGGGIQLLRPRLRSRGPDR